MPKTRVPQGHPTLFDDWDLVTALARAALESEGPGADPDTTEKSKLHGDGGNAARDLARDAAQDEDATDEDERLLDARGWDPFAGEVHPSLLLRKIIHVDMDAFYASVEERDNPHYRGVPLVVGGSPQSRGVVTTANYEARKYGIRSAMSCAMAYKLCPHALFVRPRMDAYVEVSRQVRGIFLQYTPHVEPLSLDEAYLDVTDNVEGVPAMEIARRVRASIEKETGLTASAGVAPNKMVAKIASEVNKPNGLTVVRPQAVFEFMRGLSVRKIPFVGPKTDERLKAQGFVLCEDLVRAGADSLEGMLGGWGRDLWWRAQGINLSRVSASRERKSCGEEQTFSQDLVALEDMHAELDKIAQSLWDYVSGKGFSGRTLTVKVKFADFRSVTRARTFGLPLQGAEVLGAIARELLQKTDASVRPVRLLGLSLSHLVTESGDTHIEEEVDAL